MKDDERDELLIRIDENVKVLSENRSDHEARLRGLERHKNYTLGFAAAISAAIHWIFPK